MPDHIALVGYSPLTLHHVRDISDDVEIWSASRAWDNPAIPRLDRMLEIHDMKFLKDVRQFPNGERHWDWLFNQNHDYPVYTIAPLEGIDNWWPYPYEDICAKFFGNLRRGPDTIKVLTCSVDYLMALALYEGVKEIDIIGIEMGYETEYRYQRPGIGFWMGVASAMGVRVNQMPESQLFNPKIYHLGGQMIARHTVEKAMRSLEDAQAAAERTFYEAQGKMDAVRQMVDQGRATEDELGAAYDMFLQKRDELNQAIGASGGMQSLIEMHDTETE